MGATARTTARTKHDEAGNRKGDQARSMEHGTGFGQLKVKKKVGFFTAAVWCVPALRVPLVHSLINHFRQKTSYLGTLIQRVRCVNKVISSPYLLLTK